MIQLCLPHKCASPPYLSLMMGISLYIHTHTYLHIYHIHLRQVLMYPKLALTSAGDDLEFRISFPLQVTGTWHCTCFKWCWDKPELWACYATTQPFLLVHKFSTYAFNSKSTYTNKYITLLYE